MEPLATAYLLAAVAGLLVTAGLLSTFSQRLHVPALLVFLLVGLAAGSEGPVALRFDDYPLAFRLGVVTLVLILFDGGLNTPAPVFRRVAVRASVLATVGVLGTALLVALLGIHLGLPPETAFLVGSVVSSTDAAAVFSVLRASGIRLKERVGATLEVESGLNDPMAMFLTVATTEFILGKASTAAGLAMHFLVQMGLGAIFGIAAGFVGRFLLRSIALPAPGLYPVVTIALAFGAYGVPTLLGGSGFLSVYLCGIVLGAGPLPYRAGVKRVHDALAWLTQMLMFVVLGLQAPPSELLRSAPLGIALGLWLAIVARPVATMPLLLAFPMRSAERLLISSVGLRGAVPIVLVTYPVLRGLPGAERLFHLVFFVVLVGSLVPGALVGWLARKLGLAHPALPAPPAGIVMDSLREYPGEFVWYQVSKASAVVGSEVPEVPLPDSCVMTLLVRGNEIIAPRSPTKLEVGDHVCVFVTPRDRPLVDLLFGLEESEAE